MHMYLVGGWVRDKLINPDNIPSDRDYLVVGASPEDIEILIKEGYQQVGKDFPIFISPEGEEWALARTERKIGDGYYGFSTYSGKDVTIEQDLARRDLTINAMAISLHDELTLDNILDPFNGMQDIKDKVLRHTSEAFVEDPVRVLRVARLRAKLGEEWVVAQETQELIQEIKEEGALDHLYPERVWKEMEKALHTKHPHLFFKTLSKTGLFPEYEVLKEVPQREDHHPEIWTDIHTDMVMQEAVKHGYSPEVIFACLCHDFGKVIYFLNGNLHGHEDYGVPIVENFCDNWKVPNKYRDLALLATEFHGKIHTAMGRDNQGWMKPKSIMKLFEDTRALAHPMRFLDILNVCECDAKGRLSFSDRVYPIKYYLIECLEAALVVRSNSKAISIPMKEAGKDGLQIKEAIRVSVIDAIRKVTTKWQRSFNA